jgi:hypothetical protein
MNREVMNRQMFAQGGFVRPMQEGGIASMQLMPQAAPAPDPAMMGGMPPDPAMMGGMPPEEMSMDQAAQGAMAQGVDPAMLEQTLGDYQQGMNDLDNAEDYETVINTIRGDQLPMQARYDELAGMVGPEDATATPESVLTLIQPVMQMAAVDQGIGGLAQDEMMAPIEGPMAEGIMSTVNMGPAEGPAPVNFSQGGAVQYMDNGGPVRYMGFGGGAFNYQLDNSTVSQNANAALPTLDNAVGMSPALARQKQLFEDQKKLQSTLLGAGDNEAAFEEQKNLTQAQMLFDVAQGALAFASPGDRQMSPAERLAQSFSPVLGNIGVRAGELGKFKQAQDAEDRAMDLSALTASQGRFDAELASQSASQIAQNAEAADIASALALANSKLIDGGKAQNLEIVKQDGSIMRVRQPLTVGQMNMVNSAGYQSVNVLAEGDDKLIAKTYNVTYKNEDGKTVEENDQLLLPSEIQAYKDKYGKVAFTAVADPTNKSLVFKTMKLHDGSLQEMLVGSNTHRNAILPLSEGGLNAVSELGTAIAPMNILLPSGEVVVATPGTTRFENLTKRVSEGGLGGAETDKVVQGNKDRTQVTLTEDVEVMGHKYKAGSSPNFTKDELEIVVNQLGAAGYTAYKAPVGDAAYFTKYGMLESEFKALPKATRESLQGIGLSDLDYFDKFGMSQAQFTSLPVASRNRLWGIAPEYEFKQVNNGEKIVLMRFDKNDPDKNQKGVEVFNTAILQSKDLFRVSMPDAEGVMTPTVIDLNTTAGQKAMEKVNALNAADPGSARMQKIGTESNTAVAFMIPDEDTGKQTIAMSYDGGATYTGTDGLPKKLPANAMKINDTQTANLYSKEVLRSQARDWLEQNDALFVAGLARFTGKGDHTVGNHALENQGSISVEEKDFAKNVLGKVRAGTGPLSAIQAAVNGVVGGFITPEAFSKMFKDVEEGRQYVKLIRIMGRSALAASPRFAVADLEATGKLFPSEETFFANPASEAKKLVMLVGALKEEEIRLQSIPLATTNDAVIATRAVKLQEISRIKQLLGPQMWAGMSSPEATIANINSVSATMASKMPDND